MDDAPTSADWDLLPLTPGFIEAEHGGYATAINKALDNSEIRNIALSGNYGVGKSSILQRVSELNSDKVVELSLSTLAPIETSKLDDSVPVQATTPTNQIQQEIVKQLLYREEPEKTSGSRFRRIVRFSWKRQLALSTVVGFGVTLVFLITEWASTIVSVLTPLLDMGLWIYPILLALTIGSSFLMGYLFHGRLSIKQFSAGPAAVTLDENSVSYFDQYLDEIVYFFETSDRDIVIFEDIDRFNNSHIFETLRSLNTLLNASPQINKPVRFIYAIKDSIFDPIGLELEGRKADTVTAEISDPAQAESVRANRTKFFDLVIPVVPFITHRSARNLTSQTLDSITHDVSDELIDLAGRFVPDMRLLKNVRNEFVVFRDRIFSGGGKLLELSETDLFAMMLFKSTHLTDFEVIRLGSSNLDRLYEFSRRLVTDNIRRLESEARSARQELAHPTKMTARADQLGDRLIGHIDRLVRIVGWQKNYGQYLYGAKVMTPDELKSPAFWREVATDSTAKFGWNNPQYGGALSMSRSDVAELVGDSLDQQTWRETDKKSLESALAANHEQLKFLRGADMGDLLKRPEFLVTYGDADLSLETIAVQLLSRGLALQLIRAGFINRNFTLYTSTFHGDRVSPTAMNFIIHHIERDRMDEYFELKDDDVDAVVRERGKQSLRDPALYNIAILDRLLRSDTPAAEIMIGSLTKLDGDAIRFLQAYLNTGSEHSALIKRFVPKSSLALKLLALDTQLDDATRMRLVSQALASLAEAIEYEVNDEVAAFLRDHYEDFDVLKSDEVDAAAAGRIASIFEAAELRVASLENLGVRIRDAFVARDLYVVDLDNLNSALGVDTGLALDTIRESNDAVYANMLGNLPAYLSAVDGFSATNDSEAGFLQTVDDIIENAPAELVDVIQLASPASRVEDIDDVATGAWPVLAQFHRFPASFGNVASYIKTVGSLDAHLANLLSTSGSISVAKTQPQAERKALALKLLESRDVLSAKTRAYLVASLRLKEYIAADEITPEQGELFAALIGLDVISDDDATFARIGATSWSTREKVIEASESASTLVTPVFVGSDLGPLMKSSVVTEAVKLAIIDRADEFVASADRAGMTELARFADRQNQTLAVDVLELMISNGVAGNIILPMLRTHIQAMTDDRLFGILRSLGGSFAQLAAVGRDKPKVSNTSAMLELLSSLSKRGIVNSFDPKSNPIKVNKKHK